MIKSKFHFSILGRDRVTEQSWIEEVKKIQRGLGGALGAIPTPATEVLSNVILIDAGRSGWQQWLDSVDPSGKSFILVLNEEDGLPSGNDIQRVSDLLVHPFRVPELLSVVKHHHERVRSEELLAEAIAAERDLMDANATLERILQAKTPKRYSGIKGLQIMSKHLSGLKPGGDYFDVFESDKKDFVNLLLVDSSSYGVSAAILGMILSCSARMANDHQVSTSQWVRNIYEELRLTLGEQGHFSMFFGRLNRRDFSLHYQLFGSVEGFVVDQSGTSRKFEKSGEAISNRHVPAESEEKILKLQPKDRLVLLSDGFVKGIGGEFHLDRVFRDRLEREPFALVNELAFLIKSRLNEGETFPGEDCSAIVIDVEKRVLRLAPTG
jgi:sigma-B regulation protein RsbU (phosphoserine phosphatase)